MTRHVVVVGGGISGLTAALRLAEQLGDTATVELREATPRVGGKLRTTAFAGRAAVDEGADAFLARVPDATALARQVGLELTSPTDATAAVWHGGLHPIPDGLLLGVPTDVVRLARGRLLSWRGTARAAVEPFLPRRGDPGDSIGSLVRARFGDEVHVRLVDALVGSIYGADTDRFSLAMVPQLAALAESRSLLLGARRIRRRAPVATGPVFHAPVGGMETLASAVAEAAVSVGVTVTTSAPVREIAADGAVWRVDGAPADAVVLAGPAAASAMVVAGTAPDLARLLGALEYAGVAIVTAAVDGWPAPLAGRSGYLVPKDVQESVTAVSFGSRKWAHWAARGDGELLRISLGRDGRPVDDLDDAEVVTRAVAETGRHLGLDLQPTAVRVTRWPGAFPQYRPHHRRWLAAVDDATPAGLFLTGASYRGIGVPACVADATRAAQAVATHLAR